MGQCVAAKSRTITLQNSQGTMVQQHMQLYMHMLETSKTRSTYGPMPRWGWIAYGLLLEPQHMQINS